MAYIHVLMYNLIFKKNPKTLHNVQCSHEKKSICNPLDFRKIRLVGKFHAMLKIFCKFHTLIK